MGRCATTGRIGATAIAATMIVLGCGTARSSLDPTPVPPIPTTSPVARSATPANARLTVTGAGKIEGLAWYYGCMASFLVVPGPGTLDRDATYEDPRFAIDRTSTSACTVSGRAIGAPETLIPGTYRIGGAISEPSDVSSPGYSGTTIMGSWVGCAREIIVLPATEDVSIVVTFAEARCRLDVTSR